MSWSAFILIFGSGFMASRFLHRNASRATTRAAASYAQAAAASASVRVNPLAARLPYLTHEHAFLPTMTRQEALLVLGFAEHEDPAAQEIDKKFRQVMAHHHTDVGGSPLITRKVLDARKILTSA